MRVYAGTSGYSYPAWKGRFYPKKLPQKEMLAFYSQKFSSVEINNTFYKMPTAQLIRSWADEVGEDFIFAVKAPQKITHIQRLKGSRATVAALHRRVALLGEQLGPILFQLPPNFKKDFDKLVRFLTVLPNGVRVAFEFRHESWFTEDVYDLFKQHAVALCIAEDEKLATPLVATANWGYLRLRREDYVEADLRRWADRIKLQQWDFVHVYFKHEDKAKGPKLAALLQTLM
jgi:uncharacterized protein YecE (DUF72 family)